jgi:hypothetical protein
MTITQLNGLNNTPDASMSVMSGGMMSQIGRFLKKNALLIGLGVAATGLIGYQLLKPKKRGLSGVRKYKSHPKIKMVSLK